MKLNTTEKQYIAGRYQNDESIPDIAISIGISENAVKRALADLKILNLSWYKTDDQHTLLTRLADMGIHDVNGLNNYIQRGVGNATGYLR